MAKVRRIVVGTGVVAVVAAGGFYVAHRSAEHPADEAAAQSGSATAAPATSSPALVTDANSVEPGPGAPVATDPPPVTDGSTTQVVLSLLDWDDDSSTVEAAGFVSGVVEAGGTCTVQLTRNATTVTAEAPAEPDASTTVCGGLTIDGDQVSPGTWSGVLTYSSPSSSGTSSPVELRIPAR